MNLFFSFWLFLASSGLMIASASVGSDILIFVSGILILITGIHIGLVMGVSLYPYTSVLFLFHLLMIAVAFYVYINRDMVIRTDEFVFSTFTGENLSIALIVLTSTLVAVLLPWSIMVRRNANILKTSPQKAISDLVGILDFFSRGRIHAILVLSFLSAVILITTNTTVLEVPYPFNRREHWIPGSFLKLPTILAAIGIIAGYYKFTHYGLRYYITLNMARINFVVTPVLMLLLTGSRGYFVFLWLLAGLMELYLFLKKRGSLFCCIIFLFLAYFSYQSWPYLRWNLSEVAFKTALIDSINLALFRSGEVRSSIAGYSGIDLGNFTMVSMSLFHLLYVIELIRDGISLGGSTFINLFPQALPSFLDGILWDRPLNDNWRLGEYYRHGGGFLAVANAYWNGGLAVTIAFVLTLSVIFIFLDYYLVRGDSGTLYKFSFWLLLPVMTVQLGYGIQGLARMFEIILFIIVIDRIFSRRSKRFRLTKQAST